MSYIIYITDPEFPCRVAGLLRNHGFSVEETHWQPTPEDRPFLEIRVQKDKASVTISGREEGGKFQFSMFQDNKNPLRWRADSSLWQELEVILLNNGVQQQEHKEREKKAQP